MKSENLIRLDQFLKLQRIVQSGGQAKLLVQSGAVQVNGVTVTRRGRQLHPGDTVSCNGQTWPVESDDA